MNGATLTLTYNETLGVSATPSSLAFTVNVNGQERSIIVVGLAGAKVLLTLSTAVESGDTVTVAYAKPSGTNVIKDTQGREADSFTGQAVANNTAASSVERSDPVQAPRLAGGGPPRERQAPGILDRPRVRPESHRIHLAMEGVRDRLG